MFSFQEPIDIMTGISEDQASKMAKGLGFTGSKQAEVKFLVKLSEIKNSNVVCFIPFFFFLTFIVRILNLIFIHHTF